jgi:hypothetical protein
MYGCVCATFVDSRKIEDWKHLNFSMEFDEAAAGLNAENDGMVMDRY